MSDLMADEKLLSLLASARWYVNVFDPRTPEEDLDREALLGEIDMVFPPSEPLPEMCGEQYCCRPKGHDGAHDDIPF